MPSRPASSARVLALVTPGAEISSRQSRGLEWVTATRSPSTSRAAASIESPVLVSSRASSLAIGSVSRSSAVGTVCTSADSQRIRYALLVRVRLVPLDRERHRRAAARAAAGPRRAPRPARAGTGPGPPRRAGRRPARRWRTRRSRGDRSPRPRRPSTGAGVPSRTRPAVRRPRRRRARRPCARRLCRRGGRRCRPGRSRPGAPDPGSSPSHPTTAGPIRPTRLTAAPRAASVPP